MTSPDRLAADDPGARRPPAGPGRERSSPPPVDVVLLVVAVVAVSTSGPLIRGADAPSLSVAFWRNALVLPLLVGAVLAVSRRRRELLALGGRERRLAVLAGVFLATHFAAWVPSLAFTAVASSVALVATQPVWAALIARSRGEHVPRMVWWGIAVAMVGAVLLTGVDLSISPRALAGDLLALMGGALAAAYVTVGAEVRTTVSTNVYVAVCYAVAATVLLVVCGLSRQPLTGYDDRTWLLLAAIAIGPQLLGHTLVNRVLSTIGPVVVSVAILFEIVGAAILAWLFFDEVPPVSAVPAAACIALGVVLVVRSSPDEPAVGAPPVD